MVLHLKKVLICFFYFFSLDKLDVDERVRKDLADFVSLRVHQSIRIQTNITPKTKSSGGDSEAAITQKEKFIRHLTGLSKGNFLFAKLTLELIEKGNLVVKSSSFKVLPVSLPEIFRLELNLRFSTATAFAKVSDILSVCLAAAEPLTVKQVYQSVTALTLRPEINWSEFAANFNQLSGLLVRRGDDTVMFYHSAFREWLADECSSTEDRNNMGRATSGKWVARLIAGFFARCKGNEHSTRPLTSRSAGKAKAACVVIRAPKLCPPRNRGNSTRSRS